MKTKTELDENFDYPDGKRNLIKEVVYLILLSWLMAFTMILSIYHADSIDKFFQSLFKSAVL